MELKEAQQLLDDVRNIEADVVRLEDALAATEAQIAEAKSERLVKSAKLGKAEHTRELKEAKRRLADAKKAVDAMPEADRERAGANPPVPRESVEAYAGPAGADGGAH